MIETFKTQSTTFCKAKYETKKMHNVTGVPWGINKHKQMFIFSFVIKFFFEKFKILANLVFCFMHSQNLKLGK
jgi:hypothetical protein